MPVLTKEDKAFWEENGYVVIHNAVPPENIKAAENAIWNFLEMRPDNPDSWYPDPPRRGIMAEMYQHQALWDLSSTLLLADELADDRPHISADSRGFVVNENFDQLLYAIREAIAD